MTLHGVDALVTGPDSLATVTYRGPHDPIDARPADPAGTLVRTPLGEGFIPLLGHRSLTRSDGVEIMRGRTRRPIKISDAATELDVAVGIASWSSGIEHQAARISVVAIFFEILSLP